jgi:hypothetical protein
MDGKLGWHWLSRTAKRNERQLGCPSPDLKIFWVSDVLLGLSGFAGRIFIAMLTIFRKLVIIGDGACGKTSLLSVFTLGYFPTVSYPSLNSLK